MPGNLCLQISLYSHLIDEKKILMYYKNKCERFKT